MSLDPQRFSAEKSPQEVRLTLSEGAPVTASHPMIVGDSLVWVESSGAFAQDSTRHAVPVSSIRKVEAHAFAVDKTITLLVVMGGLIGGLIAILSSSYSGD
jgi:hypothetical protein